MELPVSSCREADLIASLLHRWFEQHCSPVGGRNPLPHVSRGFKISFDYISPNQEVIWMISAFSNLLEPGSQNSRKHFSENSFGLPMTSNMTLILCKNIFLSNCFQRLRKIRFNRKDPCKYCGVPYPGLPPCSFIYHSLYKHCHFCPSVEFVEVLIERRLTHSQ